MKAKPERSAPKAKPVSGPVTGVSLDAEVVRITTAKKKVERVLKQAAPGYEPGTGPLNKLAIYLQNAPWTDWPTRENGFPDTGKRLEQLEKLTDKLLTEIERSQSGPGALHVPGGSAWLILRMNAAIQPIRDLAAQLRRAREDLPHGEGRNAWKGWAHVFYDLAIQAWLEGGASFWLGERRQFGVHPGGKATLAVHGLLKLAGKRQPSGKLLSVDTISEFLATLPDPLPWVEDGGGADLAAWNSKEWILDSKLRRENLKKPNEEQKTQDGTKKKKRGRPRGNR